MSHPAIAQQLRMACCGHRDDFVVRLKNAVAWVNKNRHDELLYLSHNQKERAQDVLNLEGCRTKW